MKKQCSQVERKAVVSVGDGQLKRYKGSGKPVCIPTIIFIAAGGYSVYLLPYSHFIGFLSESMLTVISNTIN